MPLYTPDGLIALLKSENLLRKGYRTRKAIIRETLDKLGIAACDQNAGGGYVLQAKTAERWFLNGFISSEDDKNKAIGILDRESEHLKELFLNILVPDAKLNYDIKNELLREYRAKGYKIDINMSACGGEEFIFYCFIISLFGHKGLTLSQLLSRKQRPDLPAIPISTGFEVGKANNIDSLKSLLPVITNMTGAEMELNELLSDSLGVVLFTGNINSGKTFTLQMLYNIVCDRYNNGGTTFPVFVSCGGSESRYGINELVSSFLNGNTIDEYLLKYRYLKLCIFIDDIKRLEKKTQQLIVEDACAIYADHKDRICFFINDGSTPYKEDAVKSYTLKRKSNFGSIAKSFLEIADMKLPQYIDVIDSISMLKLHIALHLNALDCYNLPFFSETDSRSKYLCDYVLMRKSELFRKLLGQNRREIECSVITELVYDVLLPGMAYIGKRLKHKERRKPAVVYERELLKLLSDYISRNQNDLISGICREMLISVTLECAVETELINLISENSQSVYSFAETLYEVIFVERYFAQRIASVIKFNLARPISFEIPNTGYCHSNKDDDFEAFFEDNEELFDIYFLPDNILEYSQNIGDMISSCISEERISTKFSPRYPLPQKQWIDMLITFIKNAYSNSKEQVCRKMFYVLTAAVSAVCRNKDIKQDVDSRARILHSEFMFNNDFVDVPYYIVCSRNALLLAEEYKSDDVIVPFMIEEMILNVCKEARKNERGQIWSVSGAFDLLKLYEVTRKSVYLHGVTSYIFSSYINQIARLMESAYEFEKKQAEKRFHECLVRLDEEDIEYSKVEITGDLAYKINYSNINGELLQKRLDILLNISLRLLQENAEKYNSAPSANSLAVFERRKGDRVEALKWFNLALRVPYIYSTTQDYSLKKRAGLAALMFAENDHVSQAEDILGMELDKFLTQQYIILDESPEKQLVGLSLDAASGENLHRIYGKGEKLPIEGKVLLLEKYTSSYNENKTQILEKLIGILIQNIRKEIGGLYINYSETLFSGVSKIELVSLSERAERAIAASGIMQNDKNCG